MTTHRSVLEAGVAIGTAFALVALLSQRDPSLDSDEAREAVVARQQLRVEAARASLDAKPLIGVSHLPAYDARVVIAREEATLNRLSLLQQATH